MTRDVVSSTMVGASTLGYLRQSGDEVEFAEAERIIRRGERSQALYVVLSGEVELRIRDERNRGLPLCRLGPGSIFGELSVLRDAPAAADVYATVDTTALRYPAEAVPTALVEWQPLRNKLLKRLADQLIAAREETWRLFQRAETLESLVTSDGTEASMVVASPLMKAVRRRAAEVAPGSDPALIIGEPGSGRLTVARLIHELSDRSEASVLVVDCARLGEGEAGPLLFGTASSTQSSLLPGLGALELTRQGTLVLRNLERLEIRAQLQLARCLTASEGHVEAASQTRIIATSSELDRRPCPELADELVAAFPSTVRIPPLAERPRDIVPLARRFLKINAPPGVELELNESAEHALVMLGYRHRNVSELSDVVELAARCADGDQVRSEHIFGNMGREQVPGLELGHTAFASWLTRHGGVGVLRRMTAASFFAVIGLCLVVPASGIARSANGFVWSAWEPAVFALFLLAGTVWCTICPLSAAGRLAQKIVSPSRPPPAWLKSAGPWLAASGFFVILWVEVVFAMTERPRGTALLLLSLVVLSVLCCLFYRREVWCRHLCPLGQLGVALAPAAPLTVAAPRRVCQSTCTNHACFRGTVAVPGCTVFHHPQVSDQSHRCKLCLDCLQSCPHGAANLYLRPPLKSAWMLQEPPPSLAHFAIPVSLLCLLFLAAQRWPPVTDTMRLGAAGVIVLIVGWLLSWQLPRLLGGLRTPARELAQRASCALLVLGWGPLMAVQFAYMPWLASHQITHVTTDSAAGAAGPTLLVIAQVAVIGTAAVLAGLILWQTWSASNDRQRGRAGWMVLAGLVAAYLVGAFALV